MDLVSVVFSNTIPSFINHSSIELKIFDLSSPTVTVGTYNFDVTVTDGNLGTPYTFTVTIRTNSAPTFNPAPQLAHTVVKTTTAAPWTYTFPSKVDAESDPITVTADTGGAAFIGWSATSLSISDVSNASVLVGAHTVTVTLSDGTMTTVYTFTITIRTNSAPTFNPAPQLAHTVVKTTTAAPWTYTFPSKVDAESDPITVTADTGGAAFIGWSATGLSISDVSNASVLVGAHTVTVTLSDGTMTSIYTFAVAVMPPNQPPIFATPLADLTITKTQSSTQWSYNFPKASDTEGDQITVTTVLGAATFVTATTTGLSIPNISSTAVSVGTFPITVTLSDPTGQTPYNFNLIVEDPCLTSGIAPLAVPNIAAKVNGMSGTFSFSRVTACGLATFTLV